MALGVLLLVLSAPGVAQTCTPVANINNNPVAFDGNRLHGAQRSAQTFESPVGASCLYVVTVDVCKNGSPPASLVFDLYTGDVPAGGASLQATTSVAASSVMTVCGTGQPGTYGSLEISFSISATINPGDLLSLVARQSGILGSGNDSYQLGLTRDNLYASGKFCKSRNGGDAWTCEGSNASNRDQRSDPDLAEFGSCGLTSCMETPPQEVGCTLTQGYWKNHFEDWSSTNLTLGGQNYDASQLLSILQTPVGSKTKSANGAISLAYQLIAAKLNILAGADGSAVSAAIASSDNLIQTTCGSNKIPPVGTCYIAPAVTSGLVNTLTNYNEGLIGPGHCAE